MNEFEIIANEIDGEIWKDITGYETYYQVSNLGRIRSLRNNRHTLLKNPIIRKPYVDKKGYLYVNLRKDTIEKRYAVHRIVAQEFIPNPMNYPEVNHKDENPSNPNVKNLEWCTKVYNVNYGTAIERSRRKRMKKVSQYTLDEKLIGVYSSVRGAMMLARAEKVTSVCKRRKKYITSGGYIWKYGTGIFEKDNDTINIYVNGKKEAEILADLIDINDNDNETALFDKWQSKLCK